jgi:quercetin dioxygenase-like cupin family protein
VDRRSSINIRKEANMDVKAFEAGLRRDGYNEIYNREYPPGFQAADHTHAFDVRALVLGGEIRLKTEGVEQAYRTGDVFVMEAGCLHAEAVGPEGVTYLVGRRHVK